MNKEQKKLIITIVVVLLVAGAMGYFCHEASKQKQATIATFAIEENRLSDMKAKIRTIPRLKAEIDQLKGKIDFYERTLPSAKEAEETLKLIQVLLVRTGIKIDSLAPTGGKPTRRRGAVRQTGPYTRHEFKMKISGSYHQLGRFISGLEHLKRFTTIEEMTIGTGSDSLKVDMTVVTYSFKGGKV